MNLFLKCVLPITPVKRDDFDRLLDAAKLIVADCVGPKVMKLPSQNFIKIFRRKHLVSSALFAPYAIRFVNNAFKLKALDIPCLHPTKILYCKNNHTYIVEYEPLEGELLRGLLQQPDNRQLLEQTARFIAELHKKGVYFRSLHFENVVFDNGRFGLIDVADMKIYPTPLNKKLRERNFQHFLRYPQDLEILEGFGLDKFEKLYHRQVELLG